VVAERTIKIGIGKGRERKREKKKKEGAKGRKRMEENWIILLTGSASRPAL
jgi:hypothetical protein